MKFEFSKVYFVIRSAIPVWFVMTVQLCAQTSSMTSFGLADLEHNVLFREGDLDLSFGQTASGFAFESNSPAWTWAAGMLHVTPSGELNYGKADGDNVSLFAERAYWLTRAELRTPKNHLRLESFRRIRRSNPDDYGATIQFQPNRWIGLATTFEHRNWKSFPAEFNVMGEAGSLLLVTPSNMVKFSIRVQMHSGVILTGSASEMSLTPGKDFQGQENLHYLIEVDGLVKQSSTRLVKSFDPITDISVGYYGLAAKTSVESFVDGRRFGHFGIVDGEFDIWDASLRHGRGQFGIRFGSLKAEVAGTVDAWPFASGLLRFLGERRHFMGEVELGFKNVWFELAPTDKEKQELESEPSFMRSTLALNGYHGGRYCSVLVWMISNGTRLIFARHI